MIHRQPNTTLIICDKPDKEVLSLANQLENFFIIDTYSLSNVFRSEAFYIGDITSLNYPINSIESQLPKPSSVGSIYWRSLNPSPFMPAAKSPRNGIASICLILEQYSSAKWFNSPRAFWAHINKPLQLKKISDMGIKVPETLYTTSDIIAKNFINQIKNAVIKPISGGDYTRKVSPKTCDDILATLFKNEVYIGIPSTIQRFVEGVNVRSYVIGNKVYSAKIISELVDYRTDAKSITLPISTNSVLESLCLKVKQALGLRWTAIDWILEGNEYIFLEANFSPMFYDFQKITGYPISALLAKELSGN